MDYFAAKGKHHRTVSDESNFQITFGSFYDIGLVICRARTPVSMAIPNKTIKRIDLSILPLLNSINDSLAHNIVPFVDELLPILTDPILTIYFDQF